MRRACTNLFVDGLAFAVIMGLTASGLLIRWILPPGSGQHKTVWGLSRHEWGDLHFYLVCAVLLLLVVHLVLHWPWIYGTVKRLFHSRPAQAQLHRVLGVTLLGFCIFSLVIFLLAAQASVINSRASSHSGTGPDGLAAHTDSR